MGYSYLGVAAMIFAYSGTVTAIEQLMEHK